MCKIGKRKMVIQLWQWSVIVGVAVLSVSISIPFGWSFFVNGMGGLLSGMVASFLVQRYSRKLSTATLFDFPKFWELLGFSLPKKTRERIFDPAFNDLVAQHLKARDPKFATRWQVRWLNFCFAVQSIRLILACYKVLTVSAAVAGALRLLPAPLKEWVAETFYSIFRS